MKCSFCVESMAVPILRPRQLERFGWMSPLLIGQPDGPSSLELKVFQMVVAAAISARTIR